MQTQWQKTLIQISFWLIIEILLNLLGLDNLADYSEFVFDQKTITVSRCISEVELAIWMERNPLQLEPSAQSKKKPPIQEAQVLKFTREMLNH